MNLEIKYLIDAVSITKLPIEFLRLDFVQKNSFIPAEIFYEIRSAAKKQVLLPIVDKVDCGLLNTTIGLLREVGTNNKVLDLYNNEGNGDIALVATALFKKEQQVLTLFQINWVIVTDDNGLKDLAGRKAIVCISTEDFINLLSSKSSG
jgi:hypothetical protein